MSRLAGKTALVTGATSGIGRAVAERLAGEGAQVILSGRDLDRGEQVVAAIRSSGGSARFVRADLAKLEDVKRLAAESGQADILVNNAGVFPFGPTSETGRGGLRPGIRRERQGPVLPDSRDRAADGRSRRRSDHQHLDDGGLLRPQRQAVYGASKAAIELLTKAWTDEYGPGGIRVNAVAPGPTRTPGTEPMGAALDQMAATLPARHAARRRADRIGRRVPRIRGGELHLRSRGARRRREGRRLMTRTHAQPGWATRRARPRRSSPT